MSLLTTNVKLILVLEEEVRGSVGFMLWKPLMSVRKFMAIHQIAVEIFQSGQKGQTDRPTDTSTSNTQSILYMMNAVPELVVHHINIKETWYHMITDRQRRHITTQQQVAATVEQQEEIIIIVMDTLLPTPVLGGNCVQQSCPI